MLKILLGIKSTIFSVICFYTQVQISYLKRFGISGGMVWSLESDDIRGRCNEGKWPLLTRIHEMLNGKDKDNYETPPKPDPNWDITTTIIPQPKTIE